jgi:hypothetical protein
MVALSIAIIIQGFVIIFLAIKTYNISKHCALIERLQNQGMYQLLIDLGNIENRVKKLEEFKPCL